jgi:hypothetical protein
MTKFEVDKKYRYTDSLCGTFDFIRIGIDIKDAVHIASGKPLTVEWYEHPRRIKFEECSHPWTFTDTMLERFEKVADDTHAYGESAEPSKTSYIAHHIEWVKENNVKVGATVRVTRTAEDYEGGWGNTWESDMDENVGKIGTVREIEPSHGLLIDFGTGEDRVKYCYPYFVLEVVNDTLASNDTYVPIKEFEEGKWYVCHAVNRPSSWNEDGKMDGLLDGKPHKCIMGRKHKAEFEDIPRDGNGWNFYSTMYYFEEVPAPEVDWEEKYTVLKYKVIEMLSILGDASGDFKKEIESL